MYMIQTNSAIHVVVVITIEMDDYLWFRAINKRF
jgi:hypothetical protein